MSNNRDEGRGYCNWALIEMKNEGRGYYNWEIGKNE